MKANKILLTGLVLTSIVGTSMASTNNQIYTVGHYRNDVEANNSLLIGTDNNVTQHNDGNVVENIIVGGYNNMVQHDGHNSLTVGVSNNNNSTNSLVGGDHNTITNAKNSIGAGYQNASHSANTLIVGNTNAIDFESENSIAAGNGSKLRGSNSFIMGKNAKADGDQTLTFGDGAETKVSDTYAIGRGAVAGSFNTIAIGNDASSEVENSIALGSFSKTEEAVSTNSAVIGNHTYNFAGGVATNGTVSVGDIGKERTITNVAAGRISDTSTDAINGSQLHSVIEEMSAGDKASVEKANTYTDTKTVNALNEAKSYADNLNISNRTYTDNKVAHVGASAAALSALHPLDYNPDHKTDIMAGVGHYKGKTAVALGVAYRPNENVLLSLGTTINGKDTMVNAGVSYKVGAKDSTYRSPASMAKDIDDLKAIVNKVLEENKQLREQLNSK